MPRKMCVTRAFNVIDIQCRVRDRMNGSIYDYLIRLPDYKLSDNGLKAKIEREHPTIQVLGILTKVVRKAYYKMPYETFVLHAEEIEAPSNKKGEKNDV